MFLGSDSLEILLKYIYPNIFIKKMKRFFLLQYIGKTKLIGCQGDQQLCLFQLMMSMKLQN
jgi:hypothetical protein